MGLGVGSSETTKIFFCHPNAFPSIKEPGGSTCIATHLLFCVVGPGHGPRYIGRGDGPIYIGPVRCRRGDVYS